MLKVFLTTAFLSAAGSTAYATDYLIFGGTGHDVYLGCLNCNELNGDSICNKFGKGNKFDSDSIFNKFGQFGNKFSSSSPWNKFSSSTDVPVLVDRDGNFYGYFTTNKFRPDAVGFSDLLADIFEAADGDMDVARELLCRSLK